MIHSFISMCLSLSLSFWPIKSVYTVFDKNEDGDDDDNDDASRLGVYNYTVEHLFLFCFDRKAKALNFKLYTDK